MPKVMRTGAKAENGNTVGVRSDNAGNIRTESKEVYTEVIAENVVLAKGTRKLINIKTPRGFRVIVKPSDATAKWELSELPIVESTPGQEWLGNANRQLFLASNGTSAVFSEVKYPLYPNNRLSIEHLSSSPIESMTFSIIVVHFPNSSNSNLTMGDSKIALPVDVQYTAIENIVEIVVADNLNVPALSAVTVSKFDVSNYKYYRVLVQEKGGVRHSFNLVSLLFDKSWINEYGFDLRHTVSFNNVRHGMTEEIPVKSPAVSVRVDNNSDAARSYKVTVLGIRG